MAVRTVSHGNGEAVATDAVRDGVVEHFGDVRVFEQEIVPVERKQSIATFALQLDGNIGWPLKQLIMTLTSVILFGARL